MTKLTLLSRAAATAAAVLGACLLALAVVPATGLAAATAKATGENTPLNLSSSGSTTHTSSGGGASIVRTIVGLAIVIAVIWGLSWILRQVKAGRGGAGSQSSAGLTSIAALNLSSGRSVHLVRAGSEYVLLGSAEHGVVPIHHYTEQQARDAGLLAVEEQTPPRRRSLLLPRPADPPVAGSGRYDPTRIPSQSSGVIERLREWTVRR
jgi:flagellar protein FliO/FliZ